MCSGRHRQKTGNRRASNLAPSSSLQAEKGVKRDRLPSPTFVYGQERALRVVTPPPG
jgi:hypothetical protein